MGRAFVSASSQYLSGTVPVTALPLTVACWAYQTDVTGNHGLIELNVAGAAPALALGTVGGTLRAQHYDGSNNGYSEIATVPTGSWYHAAAVFSSTSNRLPYLNGVAGSVTAAATASIAGLSTWRIGSSSGVGLGYQNGRIAEVGIWDVALTAAELLLLAAGVSPRRVRPQNLIGFPRLAGYASPEIDLIGHRDLTVTGATASAHPRIYLPWAPTMATKTPVAGGTGRMFQVF